MATQSDLDINREVRRILVKHWIDLGRISVRSSQGRVLIRGSLLRIPGTTQELTTPIVESMFSAMQRLRGVKHLTAHVDNWIKEGGRWRPFERHGARVDKKDSLKSAAGTITID